MSVLGRRRNRHEHNRPYRAIRGCEQIVQALLKIQDKILSYAWCTGSLVKL